MNVQSVFLDVTKQPSVLPVVRLGQGDRNGTTLKAAIYDDGAPLSLSGKTARFCMRLPDGKTYYQQDGDVSGSTATFQIDESRAAAVKGATDVAYVEVLEGSKVVCSTSRISVVVLEGAKEGAEPAQSWVSGIDETVKAMEDAAAAASSVAASLDKQLSDQQSAFDAAEAARSKTFQQAESARATAEKARASAEEGRASAEAGRASAEEGRVSAEAARAAAEAGRVSSFDSKMAEMDAALDGSALARISALERRFLAMDLGFDPGGVTWSEGTWGEISAMLDAHYAGMLDIHDYWAVGDERKVDLDTRVVEGVGHTQRHQLTFALADPGSAYGGPGEVSFVVCSLYDRDASWSFPMSLQGTNSDGWGGSSGSGFCGILFGVLPPELQSLVREVNVKTAVSGGSDAGKATNQVTASKVFLPAEIEVTGESVFLQGRDLEEASLPRWLLFARDSDGVVVTWTRSARLSSSTEYRAITTDTSSSGPGRLVSQSKPADANYPAQFAFCI